MVVTTRFEVITEDLPFMRDDRIVIPGDVQGVSDRCKAISEDRMVITTHVMLITERRTAITRSIAY